MLNISECGGFTVAHKLKREIVNDKKNKNHFK